MATKRDGPSCFSGIRRNFCELQTKKEQCIFTKITSLDIVFKEISGGNLHTIALDNNGEIWICGSNSVGQLGLGDSKFRPDFVKCLLGTKFNSISACGLDTVALDINGNIWMTGLNTSNKFGFGDKIMKQFTQLPSSVTFKSINVTDSHFVALDIYGNIWTLGSNATV